MLSPILWTMNINETYNSVTQERYTYILTDEEAVMTEKPASYRSHDGHECI